MKKLSYTRIISPKDYCPKDPNCPLDVLDMILQRVAYEDKLNHNFTPIEIPRMNIIRSIEQTPTFLAAFKKEIGNFFHP